MSWQTLESLKERKLDNWLKKGIITEQQYKDITIKCVEYGFWAALGYATRLKYKFHPELQKKYEYKWIRVPKKECLLMQYTTSGKWSKKHRKRFRSWRNIFFFSNGNHRTELIKDKYPDWDIFFIKHGNYNIGLRKEIK